MTLITGDWIGVSAGGKPVAIQHGEGHEHIPVELQTADGHAYALPLDAVRLIEQGRVDRRLFDVTTLNRPEYRKAQAHGLGYIVTYQGAGSDAKADLHRADGTRSPARTRRSTPRPSPRLRAAPPGSGRR